MNILRNYYGLIIVLVFSVVSILPFFNNGFFPMHDDTQVQRVFEMGKALKDGVFPVRWASDLGYGYGYPIFNFYAPFSYYIGGFINILGFDALVSTKIMMALGIIMAGIFMYALAREFWGEVGGIVSGLFYLYVPYHAVDIYVRGDVAEFWAYAFIPLMFLGFYKVYRHSGLSRIHSSLDSGVALRSKSPQNDNPKKIQSVWKWIVVGSIGYTGIILSHNLTAMMITPFLLILLAISFYLGIRKKQLSTFNFQLSTLILGILVSAFYWLPALLEMKNTNVLSQIGGGADFRDHFVCIQQVWNSQWGFGGSTKGCIDGMSFKMGKLHILFSVISLILISIIVLKNKLFIHYNDTYHQSNKIIAILFSLFGLLISLLLMLEVSKPIWETIPLMAFFQYPWRFLILVSFFSSFVAGSVIWLITYVIARRDVPDLVRPDEAIYVKERLLPPDQVRGRNDGSRVMSYIISAVLLFLLIFFNAKLFNPQTILSKAVDDYTDDRELRWRVSKISDEYMPKGFEKPEEAEKIVNQRLIVSSGVSGIIEASSRTQSYLFDINVTRKSNFLLKIAPFPGWKAELNKKLFVLNATDQGYIFSLEPGKYSLNVSFRQTVIQVIGNILSISGLAVLIIGIIYFRKFRLKQ